MASHSPQMDPLLGEMQSAVSGVCPRPGSIPLYSTTTGKIASGTPLMRSTGGAIFASRCCSLPRWSTFADGFNAFVEIGPHPVLVSSAEETIQASGGNALVLGCLRRECEDRAELMTALGTS